MIDILIPRFDPANPHSAVENMKLLADKSVEDVLAFIHDDVDIPFSDWPGSVRYYFSQNPKLGMVGFGGALGLGTTDLYKRPYDYKQLARINFYSNLEDAERHGYRATKPMRVSVLDGFCQIIRRTAYDEVGGWQAVLDMGLTFHMYDAAMACLMAEHGWEVWMLPIACKHYGGRTSCSPEYDAWLRSQGINGDLEVHQRAHRIIYDRFRNVLPLRVGGQ